MPLIVYIWRRHGGTCKFSRTWWLLNIYKSILYQNRMESLIVWSLGYWTNITAKFNTSGKFNSPNSLFQYFIIITLLPFFIEMLQYDWLWSGHMINAFIPQWNVALHWKCTSVNAFIPQWNFKRMHSILKIIFKNFKRMHSILNLILFYSSLLFPFLK
jgi:hypothetical protein